MKLQVTLVLLCLLCPQALAVKCYQCTQTGISGTCTDTQTSCPKQCASVAMAVGVGGQQNEINMKTCAAPEDCGSGRLNLGTVQVTMNSVCCSTDLCNTQKATALPQQSVNGKQCYYCANEDCSGVVKCVGDEDRCITISGTAGGVQVRTKGCASKNLCSTSGSSMQAAGISGDISCCDGNLCNSAKSIKLSLLIMLGPLLSSMLFLH